MNLSVFRTEIFTVLAVLLFGGFLFPPPVAAAEKMLIIPGSGDSQHLLRRLAEMFNRRSGFLVAVPDAVGSSGGIRQVLTGRVELARVARRLKKNEVRAGLVWRMFARSPVVFATHPDHPGLKGLTFRQIEGIFSGRLTNWAQLGGRPGKIYVARREAGEASRLVLARFSAVFQKAEAGQVVYSTLEMRRVLMRTPGSIGYLPLSAIKNADLNILRIDGVAPDADRNGTGRYPYAVPLALVWRPPLAGLAARFRDFLFSDEAGRVMERFGAFPAGGD